jgi:hypothetical protein
MATGYIDYNQRNRESLVETNRLYAASRIEMAIERSSMVRQRDLLSEVLVSSEVDPFIRHRSMVSREFEFVISHTVHHYALIADRLAKFGVGIDKNFGVAASTLEYWKQVAA